MYKVVIDTNVVISAMLTPAGNAARIIDLINDEKLQICFNDAILDEFLDEFIEVLARPHFGFSISEREGLIEGFRKFGLMIKPNESDIPFVDADDRIFHDVAKACEAELITGNIKHYPNESFIMSPAAFMASLEENSKE